MSLPIDIEIANPDPSAAPTTFAELIEELRTLITAEVTGTYLPYVTGSTTPIPADQDKAWHRTDSSGRPIGTYIYYNGAWRRQYTGRQNQIVMYAGDPGTDFAGTGGRGTVGGEWDGFALCNGNNGTPDLSDKFIVASHMSDMSIGYSGGNHSTNVSGATTQSGGAASQTLTDDNTYRPARGVVEVRRWEADGNTPNGAGDLYGQGSGTILLAADAGNTSPDPVPTLPPYVALAYAMWVGYE